MEDKVTPLNTKKLKNGIKEINKMKIVNAGYENGNNNPNKVPMKKLRYTVDEAKNVHRNSVDKSEKIFNQSLYKSPKATVEPEEKDFFADNEDADVVYY